MIKKNGLEEYEDPKAFIEYSNMSRMSIKLLKSTTEI